MTVRNRYCASTYQFLSVLLKSLVSSINRDIRSNFRQNLIPLDGKFSQNSVVQKSPQKKKRNNRFVSSRNAKVSFYETVFLQVFQNVFELVVSQREYNIYVNLNTRVHVCSLTELVVRQTANRVFNHDQCFIRPATTFAQEGLSDQQPLKSLSLRDVRGSKTFAP